MKKKMLGFITGLFLIIGLTQSGYAASFYIDIDGESGAGTVVSVNEWLDILSSNIVIGDVENDDYTFDNYGIVYVVGADGFPNFALFDSVSADFEFSGTGDLGLNISFDSGGTLNWEINDETIATLTVTSGDGTIDALGYPNGQLTIVYDLDVVKSGYLFWSNGDAMTSSNVAYALTTVNASVVDDLLAKSELLGMAGIDETDMNEYDFFLSSNGQLRIEPVPVPSAFLLLGSGLIGLIGFRRRNS